MTHKLKKKRKKWKEKKQAADSNYWDYHLQCFQQELSKRRCNVVPSRSGEVWTEYVNSLDFGFKNKNRASTRKVEKALARNKGAIDAVA